ncbi:hypothetical protein L195_g045089 [Trifolium pratense]|uniref:Uncharacterized protein n=1 Tax=Trifolium pratense TaxID=57577 RepID=A0A2K3MDW4_TRIPR|nr:hypothetical protein L195_g045089 [Trifolium pratense]
MLKKDKSYDLHFTHPLLKPREKFCDFKQRIEMKWHVLQDNNICLKNHVKGSSIPAEFLITDDEIPKNEHEDDEDEKVKLETLSEGLKTLSSKLEGIENKQDEYHKEMLSSFDRIFDILKEQNEQQQKSPYIDVPDWTGPDLECDTKWLGTETPHC